MHRDARNKLGLAIPLIAERTSRVNRDLLEAALSASLLRHPNSAIDTAIETLQAMDLKSVSIEDIRQQLAVISRGWSTGAYLFAAGPDSLLMRARVCDRLPEYLSEIGAPPPAMLTKFGRANFPRQSVLYASAGRSMPFFEVGARAGDRVALSVWEIAKPLTVVPMGYIPEIFKRLATNRKELPAFASSFLSAEHRAVHGFLSEQFCRFTDTEAEHNYKISATFAQMAYASKDVHGVMYPSIAMSGNGDNLALRTNVISQGLVKLRWIEWIEIDKVEGMKYTVKTRLHAEKFHKGRIAWDEIRSLTSRSGDLMRISVRNGRHRFERVDEATGRLIDITPRGLVTHSDLSQTKSEA